MRNVKASLKASTSAPIVSPATKARGAKAGAAATGKAATKPAPAPVTVKPAKPAADAVRSERQAEISEFRATVATRYNGASLTVHSHKAASTAYYAERVATQPQKIGTSGPTVRDESLLALIERNTDASGTFDPCKLACDAGVLSRLASVKLVTHTAAHGFRLTPDGISRAKLINSRKPA